MLKKVRKLARTYPPSSVQRRVGDRLIQPKRYAPYPTSAEAKAVIPKNSAINPSSLEGGDMSILKNTSEIRTIRRILIARRVSIGRRERDSFIKYQSRSQRFQSLKFQSLETLDSFMV